MHRPYATQTPSNWAEPTAIIGVAWAEPLSQLKGAHAKAPSTLQGAGKRTHTAGE